MAKFDVRARYLAVTDPVPDLSVIVVTHGGRDLALTTLRSARAAAGAARLEWFVVDSGSPDDTAAAIEREFVDVIVLRRGNIGFAAANNVALPRARGRYVLLLNPDVEIVRGTFGGLVAEMDRRPEVGIASVVQRWPTGAIQSSIRRLPSPGRQLVEALTTERFSLGRDREAELDEAAYARETDADWLVGAFLIARREAVADVGPMDERFFLYSEEKDWCYRFKLAGWGVRHLPVMEVIHHVGGYSRPALLAQLTFSKLLFAR
jgi:N-acetylglucosaminyl-diphospho-decaprenol L-rhamnosyltransferase